MTSPRRWLGGVGGVAAAVVAVAGHPAVAAARNIPGDPPASGSAPDRGNAGSHPLVAVAVASGRRRSGDPGVARPVLDSAGSMAGSGPVLLVIDNGWAAAADWPRRMQMANTVLDRAARAGRRVALLATAAGETGAAPKATAPMPVGDLARSWARCGRRHGRPTAPRRAGECGRLPRSSPAPGSCCRGGSQPTYHAGVGLLVLVGLVLVVTIAGGSQLRTDRSPRSVQGVAAFREPVAGAAARRHRGRC